MINDNNLQSLPYAEFGEDVIEDFGGGYFAAGYFAEVVEAFADIFGEEVAGEVVVHAFDDAFYGLGGMA